MTMASDGERRHIAAGLRQMAANNEGLLGVRRLVALGDAAKELMGVNALPSCAAVMRRYADLIDRPTCRLIDTDHEFEDSVRCTMCGKSFKRPWEPFRYCPMCGAEVVAR